MDDLIAAARACRRCPRVVAGTAALGAANGPVPNDILMLGEAPGRFGAGRTGVPFSGDESGRRFEALLAEAGIARADVFVSNALLCLPLDARGRNRTPSTGELTKCGTHLEATLALVQPRLVVTLGATALRALDRVEAHGLRLSEAVGRMHRWRGVDLLPLYHPGRQAELHRGWSIQVEDWRGLGRAVAAARRCGIDAGT